jgi:hypothetical protein
MRLVRRSAAKSSDNTPTMDVDNSSVPSELAFSLAEQCQRWADIAYSGDSELNEVPRNPHIDRQYETRLDRAITDLQAKIQSQRRALEDVLPSIRNNGSCGRNIKMRRRNSRPQYST